MNKMTCFLQLNMLMARVLLCSILQEIFNFYLKYTKLKLPKIFFVKKKSKRYPIASLTLHVTPCCPIPSRPYLVLYPISLTSRVRLFFFKLVSSSLKSATSSLVFTNQLRAREDGFLNNG